MATNILTVYLNDGFNENFVTDLINYIKNKKKLIVVKGCKKILLCQKCKEPVGGKAIFFAQYNSVKKID